MSAIWLTIGSTATTGGWLGEVVAVHLLKDSFTAEDVMNLDKVSPALYLGNEQYVTISKDTVKRLDREVYGRR